MRVTTRVACVQIDERLDHKTDPRGVKVKLAAGGGVIVVSDGKMTTGCSRGVEEK